MRVRTLAGALSIALLLAAITAQAREKDRVFVGCVEARKGKFELATVSVKGRLAITRSSGATTFPRTSGTASA
jgi:hypothetical protein